jgi:hypothetical protein
MEHASQVFHWVLPAPPGKKINFAKFSGERVNRTGGPNPYAGDFTTGNLCRLSQQASDRGQAVRVAAGISGRLLPGQYLPTLSHYTNRYFCSADVNGPDHETFLASSLPRQISFTEETIKM